MNVRINEWIKGTIITEEENLNLPVPRLEIRYFNINEDGNNLTAIYSLIYKHFLGDLVNVIMGQTNCRYPKPNPIAENGIIKTPFKDGVHIENDKKQLNLPAYAIYKDKYQIV